VGGSPKVAIAPIITFIGMRTLLLVWAMLMALAMQGQTTVIARVVDAADRQPLPYATVAIQGTTRGTITNREGWFSLPVEGPRDSLRFSFVGYRTLVLPFNIALDGQDIRLERAVQELGEAVIRPGEDLYARVVAASNWLRRAPEVDTKLFFSLETHSDEQPVELLHAYYNATFRAAILKKLTFKQGFIGIAPKGDRHFINYNTAGAFVLMDIHATAGLFPPSPLEHTTARGLKQHFSVEMLSRGEGPDAVDHLLISPRDSSTGAFRTELWLVPGGTVVRAVELACINCSPQPFIPLFDHGRIDTVDLRYRQTWSTTKRPVPEVIELNYSVAYTGRDFSDRMNTKAIMHAFEQGNSFIPTLFPWRMGMEEYPSIAWMPMDTVFWERMNPPLPTDQQARDRAFIMKNDIRRNGWFDSLRLDHHHLRPRYVAWSAENAVDSTYLWNSLPHHEAASKKLPAVRLRTHLYLDMDTTGGAFTHRSIAVLDAGGSWFLYRPWENFFDAFINIYFDLCEIERRAMEERLDAPGMTLEKARRIHDEHTQRMRDQQRRMWVTVWPQWENLMNWNRVVRNALQVDRIHELIMLRRDSGPPPVPPLMRHGP
jgi:hypothetical protein